MTAPTKLNRRERRRVRQAELAAADEPLIASITAAAVNVRVSQNWQNMRWGGTEWATEAWAHYDSVPEFHSGVNIGANNLSRARLLGVNIDPETGEAGTQPTDDPDVREIMGELFGGPTGQSQALAQLYRLIDVGGEGWVLATDNPDLDRSAWEILPASAVTASPGSQVITIMQMNGMPRQFDDEHELLVRIWQPHPVRRWEADSSARSLLVVLRELQALTAMVSATVKSRLASAGILWIPEEITLPKANRAPNGVTMQRTQNGGAEGWLDLITEAMIAPIKDPDSASAVVPLIAMAKAQYIDKVTHMDFGKDLDGEIEPLRQACVKRLAIGMNLPPSILLGTEVANHWTAWEIAEDYARAYLAPKLELIADALTEYYLRPALKMRGRDADQFAIGFDLDKLLSKQISVENAQLAWEAGFLSEQAYAEVLGFNESQMANQQERARRLITELLARGNPQTLAEVAGTIALLFPGIQVKPVAIPGAPPSVNVGAAKPAPAPAAIAGPPAQTTPPTAPPAGGAG